MACANCGAEVKCGNECCKNQRPNYTSKSVNGINVCTCSECGWSEGEDFFFKQTDEVRK
jgi:hypothetical protein